MAMATTMASSSLSFPSISVPLASPNLPRRRTKTSRIHPKFPQLASISTRISPKYLPARSVRPTAATAAEENSMTEEESISIQNLHRFVQLNLGNWSGSFYQFDANGKLKHKIKTRLAAGSYGEDELISLIQTLYIQQPPSNTSISGVVDELEWAEYKIKESNMFTMDKYQQEFNVLSHSVND